VRDKNILRLFTEDPSLHLVVFCDRRVKLQRININDNESISNLKYYGNYTLIIKNSYVSGAVRESI